jgi:hypothetical protein
VRPAVEVVDAVLDAIEPPHQRAGRQCDLRREAERRRERRPVPLPPVEVDQQVDARRREHDQAEQPSRE